MASLPFKMPNQWKTTHLRGKGIIFYIVYPRMWWWSRDGDMTVMRLRQASISLSILSKQISHFLWNQHVKVIKMQERVNKMANGQSYLYPLEWRCATYIGLSMGERGKLVTPRSVMYLKIVTPLYTRERDQ